MEWVQVYNPLNSAVWSPLAAGLPIFVLLGLLLVGVSAPRAALAGLVASLTVAIGIFEMPADSAMAAAAYGGCFGLLPIGWIVLAAVFLYHLTVRTGQFEIVKHSVSALSPDQRMQALLIAFSFGTFLEGAAGFGTPVAISAALLIGLGFSPLYAAGLALIANTSPVAFGALGTPIITLAKISGIPEMALSQMAGRQLTLFSLLIPVWLVAVMSGWKGVKGCWPAILVCGGSFATIQFFTSNFYGPTLVNVFGGIGSLVALAVFLRFWQPKEVWRFPENDECKMLNDESRTDEQSNIHHSSFDIPHSATLAPKTIIYAWMPWVLLSVMVFLWGWPAWKDVLNRGVGKVTVSVPKLDGVVYRNAPVVRVPPGSDHAEHAEKAQYDFNWLSATGTGIFLAAVLSAFWLRISFRVFWSEFFLT